MLPHQVMRVVGLGCGKALFPRVQASCPWTHIQRNLMTSSYFHQTTRRDDLNRNSSWTNFHMRTSFASVCHQRRDYVSAPTSPASFSPTLTASKDGIPHEVIARLGAALPCRATSAQFHVSSHLHQALQDEQTKSPSKIRVWWRHHRDELRSAPTPALVLGFSGLIPFMVPALYSVVTMSCSPNVAFAQAAYGACILSFLGGVRWGHSVSPEGAATWPSLTFSVLPSLIAWMGLMMPIQPGLFCIIAGLLFAGGADACFKSYPAWFRSLRFVLTTFTILSISVTFAFSILFPPPEPEHGYNFRKLIKIAQIIVED